MILCCGEALIDMIPGRTASGADAFEPHCGGAIFNTAIALGRLGAEAGMVTGLSRDLFGRRLKAALSESGVATAWVVESDRPTTLAFVELSDGHATYHFYDENSAGRMLTPEDLSELPDIDALYLGGISLCSAPAADTYVALAERTAGKAMIMVDPNIRPGFISDATSYRDRLTRLLAVTDVVKVSDDDTAWLLPGAADPVARMLELGPSVVLTTHGGDGASARTGDGREVHVPAIAAQVVDTVGAGDTFNAGVLARAAELGLLAPGAMARAPDDALRDILGFGARVAAVTVSRAGANPPWRGEI